MNDRGKKTAAIALALALASAAACGADDEAGVAGGGADDGGGGDGPAVTVVPDASRDVVAALLDAAVPDYGECGPAIGLQPGAPWPMNRRCPTLVNRATKAGPKVAKLAWTFVIPQVDGGAFCSASRGGTLVAADGTIYVGGSSCIVALAPGGTLKWVLNTPYISALFIATDGTLYATVFTGAYPSSTPALLAVHPDGVPAWTQPKEFLPAALNPYDARLMPLPNGDFLVALKHGNSGQVLARISPLGVVKASRSDIPMSDSPALAPNGIVIATSVSIIGLDYDLKEAWSTPLPATASYSGNIVVGRDGVSAVGLNNAVAGFFPDGTTAWKSVYQGRWRAVGAIPSGPVFMSQYFLGRGDLLVHTAAGGVPFHTVDVDTPDVTFDGAGTAYSAGGYCNDGCSYEVSSSNGTFFMSVEQIPAFSFTGDGSLLATFSDHIEAYAP